MTNFSERNQNSVPTLLAKSNAADNADVVLWADPSTHRLLCNVVITSATVAVATAAAPSYSEAANVALSTDLAGALRVTGSLSVGGTTDNSAFTAGTSTGTPAMGFYHSTVDAVTDGRSAVIGMTAKRAMFVSLYDASGNALLGQKTTANSVPVALASDATLPVTNAGTFAVQATLAAETTKVIGTVNVAASQTIAVTQATASSLNATVVGTGTFAVQATLAAETTKVIGTVRNLGNAGAVYDGVITAATAPANGIAILGVYNSTEVAPTTGQSAAVQLDAKGRLKTTIRDAAGNDRGANIDASNRLSVTVDNVSATNISTNIAQIGGTTIVNGGVAGSQSVGGTVATNVAITANPINLGAQAVSSENAAVTTARQVQLVADLVGKLIVLPYANPENFVSGVTSAMTGTTSTSLIAAPAGSLRNYVTHIIGTNSHATVGTFILIQDGSGGTTIYEGYAAAVGGGFSISFPTPLRQPTTATALYCQNVTTGANTIVSASGYKGL